MLEILKEIANNEKLYSNLDIQILTPVNPVGARKRSRYNNAGYDVNRDFYKFRTKEATIIKKCFKEYQPDFALSLHEAPWIGGVFMFVNKHVGKQMLDGVINLLTKNNIRLASKSYFGFKLSNKGISYLDNSFYLLNGLRTRFFGFKTFGAYCVDNSTPQITIESYCSGDRIQRVKAHVYIFQQIAEQIGDGL